MPLAAPLAMSSFDRRTFLGSVFATAGFAAAPDWLARAMAPQDPAVPDRVPHLRAAAKRAQANGKPLLVIVVPEDRQNEGVARSQWLGAWLSHGGASALHAVALAEIAVANVAEVKQVTGAVVAGEPHFALFDVARLGERDAPPPKPTLVKCELAPIWSFHRREVDPAEVEAAKGKVRAGLDKITAALMDGLNRHGATVATVAKASMAKLDDAQKERLARWLATERDADAALLTRMTAEVRRAAAEFDDAKRGRVLDSLTAAIEKVVVKQRVPGSRWELAGGCGGPDYEDPTEEEKKNGLLIGCGMGSVPPLCERFLDFWAPGI